MKNYETDLMAGVDYGSVIIYETDLVAGVRLCFFPIPVHRSKNRKDITVVKF